MDTQRVHTLDHLADWPQHSPCLAVLGQPIGHSLSPVMHNAALRALAADAPTLAAWSYHRFEVPPERLTEALPLFAEKGFVGLNLTVPHKVLAAAALAAGDIAPEARSLGAVNTLHLLCGRWMGHNTDGHGLQTAIAEDLGRSLAGADVVLLGAGGAGRAAALQCLRAGCRSLTIGNRSAARLEELLAVLSRAEPTASGRVRGCALPHLPADLPADAVVVNATASGLQPGEPPPADLSALRGNWCLYDMVYNPPLTPLLAAARALGRPATGGLGMLLHQGARALEIWTGRQAPIAVMRRALEEALQARRAGA